MYILWDIRTCVYTLWDICTHVYISCGVYTYVYILWDTRTYVYIIWDIRKYVYISWDLRYYMYILWDIRTVRTCYRYEWSEYSIDEIRDTILATVDDESGFETKCSVTTHSISRKYVTDISCAFFDGVILCFTMYDDLTWNVFYVPLLPHALPALKKNHYQLCVDACDIYSSISIRGPSQYKDVVLPVYGSHAKVKTFSLIMGIPIPGKDDLFIETGLKSLYWQ